MDFQNSDIPTFSTVLNAMPGERVEYARSQIAEHEVGPISSDATYDVVAAIDGSGTVRQGKVHTRLQPGDNVATMPGAPYTVAPDEGVTLQVVIFGITRETAKGWQG